MEHILREILETQRDILMELRLLRKVLSDQAPARAVGPAMETVATLAPASQALQPPRTTPASSTSPAFPASPTAMRMVKPGGPPTSDEAAGPAEPEFTFQPPPARAPEPEPGPEAGDRDEATPRQPERRASTGLTLEDLNDLGDEFLRLKHRRGRTTQVGPGELRDALNEDPEERGRFKR